MTESSVLKSFYAGSISGTVSTVLFQPFDVVKTRLQKTVHVQPNHGMLKEFSNIIKQDSVLGLWKGLTPSLWRCVPGIGFYFASLQWISRTMGGTHPNPAESLFIGASARVVAGITVSPFTVIKTRYESGDFQYRSVAHGIKSTYLKEGVKGLYRGLTPTLIRDVPFSGIYLMFYFYLKVLTSEYSSSYVTFTNGVMAGTVTSVITQPADVIKTNMQLYPHKCDRLTAAIVFIYQEGKLVGFLRGIVPRAIRRALMAAMSWTVYEEVLKMLDLKT